MEEDACPERDGRALFFVFLLGFGGGRNWREERFKVAVTRMSAPDQWPANVSIYWKGRHQIRQKINYLRGLPFIIC